MLVPSLPIGNGLAKTSCAEYTPGRESSRSGVTVVDKADLLRSACDRGDLEAVSELLDEADSELLNAKDESGWTPLHYACRGETTSHTEVVSYLIELGATVDVPDSDGWTALFLASQFAQPKTIVALLDAGASAMLKDAQGRVAAEVANGKERRLNLEPPILRMRKTAEMIEKTFIKKNRVSAASAASIGAEARPFVPQLEHLIEHATSDLNRLIARKEEEILEFQEQGVKSYTKMMRAMSKKSSLMQEWKHVNNSQRILQDLKQVIGNGMLKAALIEVKRKLVVMRQTAVSNEQTQAKMNKVGYQYCVEQLQEALKDEMAAKFGNPACRQCAEEVTATLGIPLSSGTGITPPGFRQKLQLQIEKSLEGPTETMPDSKGRSCGCF